MTSIPYIFLSLDIDVYTECTHTHVFACMTPLLDLQFCKARDHACIAFVSPEFGAVLGI